MIDSTRYHIGANCYGKVKHLRNVQHYLQNRHGKLYIGASEDNNAICNWIAHTFTSDEIRDAHSAVRATYPQRGRPYGSRNRTKPADTSYAPHSASPVASDSFAAAQALLDAARASATPAQSTTPHANGHAAPTDAATATLATSLNIDFLAHHFVRKAVFDNHDNDHNAHNIQPLRESIAVTDGAVKLALNKISALEQAKPTIVHIKKHGAIAPTNIGLAHNQFPLLLTACNAKLQNGRHLNIYVYGPPGTGKSFAAHQCHDAIFGDKYPFRMSGMALMSYEFLGHMHGGHYITTQFREAFEKGGVFCADEFDRYAAGATVALNNALANGIMAFPDGMVKRHPDFIFIACANTLGTGATHEYNTANKQDAATLNRFGARIHWPIDDALEDSIAYNKEWLAIVRQCRRNIQVQGIKGIMITPRQTLDGQALIDQGLGIPTVETLTLRQGLDDAQWTRVRGLSAAPLSCGRAQQWTTI